MLLILWQAVSRCISQHKWQVWICANRLHTKKEWEIVKTLFLQLKTAHEYDRYTIYQFHQSERFYDKLIRLRNFVPVKIRFYTRMDEMAWFEAGWRQQGNLFWCKLKCEHSELIWGVGMDRACQRQLFFKQNSTCSQVFDRAVMKPYLVTSWGRQVSELNWGQFSWIITV
jgi:hypothetical protein